MSHRYGRHGARAWLLWRKRHYVRPSLLPVPVVPKIVRVFIPAATERIIFIIMLDNNHSNEDGELNEQEEIQIVSGQSEQHSFAPVPPSLPSPSDTQKLTVDNSPMAKRARWQAVDDIHEIEGLNKNGKFVLIDLDGVADRAEDLARKDIRENHSRDDPPDDEQYKKLLVAYRDAYTKRFNDGTRESSGDIKHLHSQQTIHLREIAIQDRRTSPSNRNYHIRDLAVIRVLNELDIPLDIAENHLPQIHLLADTYQEYYSNPREGVTWPSQRFF